MLADLGLWCVEGEEARHDHMVPGRLYVPANALHEGSKYKSISRREVHN